VMDAFKEFCNSYRRDPETGKNNFCILQAEDELAAIGMVIGASWNGARSFTSTSGPGISLMSELIGLAYYAEIPAVIADIQRTGPSTVRSRSVRRAAAASGRGWVTTRSVSRLRSEICTLRLSPCAVRLAGP